ncbi:hypothetical protein COCMIDRAFT_24708 [Bipolaris oryzae ATCC 44560]|uniref:Uncharacterized protein n=1 Tax=Bipolaris oryzae ATCC 44560 TaxID=930090 RepID=W6ZBN2_COCMI|nr:uncharacterized protein COCMIDRAFT_24708 [Bipolaris oryzae ATCC 44560]EUC47385.1 hypothetical protein COCMIDRAFT_24708 [Bipolaris oryzae ATCC 44560]
MNVPKFFNAWAEIPRMFRAANLPSQDSDTPSENAEAPQNEYEQPEQPKEPEQSSRPEQSMDPKVPSENDTDKHSDAGRSENDSDAGFPDVTNASEPNDDGHNNPTPRGNGSIAKRFKILCRGVFDSVVIKVEMAVSHVKDFISNTIQTIKEKGLLDTAKEVGKWMKAHPWETALIVAPIVATMITAITLLAIGFGPTGIAAGNTAAIIQAGIGNVVAHSLFATCTSAMMGGYGAPIIFGGVWALASVATAALESAWKRWNSHKDRRLILMPRAPLKDFSKQVKDAAENFMIGSMLVAAYVTYRIKSWLQSRRRSESD